MADDLPDDLRSLVADLVRETVREVVAARAPGHAATEPARREPAHVEPVRITGDDDLQAFALHLLARFEDPTAREDVRRGRLRFRLARTGQAPGGSAPSGVAQPPRSSRRVERGAVTERQVVAAAETGTRLVLGPKAVLTPLAREKAKAMGVVVEKERT